MPKRSIRSPKTKAEVLDKILSYNFDGDLRHLAPDPTQARIERTSPNTLDLEFRDTDTKFQIVVRRPRLAMQGGHAMAVQSGKVAAQGGAKAGSKSPKTKTKGKVAKLAVPRVTRVEDPDDDV